MTNVIQSIPPIVTVETIGGSQVMPGRVGNGYRDVRLSDGTSVKFPTQETTSSSYDPATNTTTTTTTKTQPGGTVEKTTTSSTALAYTSDGSTAKVSAVTTATTTTTVKDQAGSVISADTSSDTTSKPASDSVITCGLPNTPACKLDESGTPAAVKDDQYTSKLDKSKKDQGELRDKAAGSADKLFFTGWSSVFITPPLAQCQPFVLPRNMGSLDPCPVVEGVRSVMAYLWALGAFWLSLGMIRRVI